MENYTNSKMTDMVRCYGSADGVAFRAQAGCCLWENATFRPRSVDRGQERMLRVLDLGPQILETVEENPLTSTRKLAREFKVSQFVVCRTLKEQGLHPYHVQRMQALQPNDCIRRQEFCE
jgi:hypothetical protein